MFWIVRRVHWFLSVFIALRIRFRSVQKKVDLDMSKMFDDNIKLLSLNRTINNAEWLGQFIFFLLF